MTVRRVGRRDAGLAVALVAGAAGVVQSEPALLLAATVGLLYTAYESATSAPDPDLEVVRRVSPPAPAPGEDVAVTVTLRNHGVAALPDVRVVDGAPASLRVVDGSPRFGTALEPDAEASFSYEVRARRGDHDFQPVTVACRSLSGDAEFVDTVDVETTLSCSMDVEEIDLDAHTVPQAGRVASTEPGQGVSFYGVRDYQSTDPLNRVDWKRFARTSELATVQFEATRAASVVLLVDARSDFAPRPRAPTASQLSKYAAERIATALLAEHNHVGAAFLDDGATLEPSAHRTQALRIRRFLLYERDPSVAGRSAGSELLDGFDGQAFFEHGAGETPTATDGGRAGGAGGPESAADLHRRFPDASQVVFCTPLLDRHAAETARELAAHGRSVTVVSPDVTSTESAGRTVERITREDRIADLRPSVRLVDWSPDEPLPEALARGTRRWAR